MVLVGPGVLVVSGVPMAERDRRVVPVVVPVAVLMSEPDPPVVAAVAVGEADHRVVSVVPATPQGEADRPADGMPVHATAPSARTLPGRAAPAGPVGREPAAPTRAALGARIPAGRVRRQGDPVGSPRLPGGVPGRGSPTSHLRRAGSTTTSRRAAPLGVGSSNHAHRRNGSQSSGSTKARCGPRRQGRPAGVRAPHVMAGVNPIAFARPPPAARPIAQPR